MKEDSNNQKIPFRNSENTKPSKKECSPSRYRSETHTKHEQQSPISKKSQKNSLLDLIRTDPQAKLWECILTSIISINDFCEKGLKGYIEVDKLLLDQNVFLKLCNEKQHLKMQQIVFNKSSELEKDSIVQIKFHSNPLRRLDSRDQKHKFFIEASLKKENKIDLSMNFKVTEYGYELFANLRKMNNISIEDIRESFHLDKNFNLNIANTTQLSSKSGATFFFTHDNKYVLKSISQSHAKTFISNFPKFFTYLFQNNEDSVMVRIYGLYKINVEGYEKIYFLMMENLTENIAEELILRVYDLKGSKFQRSNESFKVDISEQGKILKSIFGEKLDQNLEMISDTFLIDQIMIVRGKDNDFLGSDDIYIEMKKEDKLSFFEAMRNDVKFFEQCNLMDYSLIFIKALKNPFVGLNLNEKENGNLSFKKEEYQEEGENKEENNEREENKKENNENKRKINTNRFRKFRNYESPCKRFVYSLAIVDYLQNYDVFKLMETQIKSIFQEEISCVDAQSYGKRFLRFIISIIQSDI